MESQTGSSGLTTGTVTFLFWEEHPDAMRTALARHDDILRANACGDPRPRPRSWQR